MGVCSSKSNDFCYEALLTLAAGLVLGMGAFVVNQNGCSVVSNTTSVQCTLGIEFLARGAVFDDTTGKKGNEDVCEVGG